MVEGLVCTSSGVECGLSPWASEKSRRRQGHRTLPGLRDGIETLPGAGSRLTPESTRTASSRWPFHARIDTAAGSVDLASDQGVGGSSPPGRARLAREPLVPDPVGLVGGSA